MTKYDVVVCVGENDKSLIISLVKNIQENLLNYNKFYVITTDEIAGKIQIPDVVIINETVFPFKKKDIDSMFNVPSRSGWYLQQLLKIYAPIVINDMLDNYLIVDADVFFHKKVCFFENDKIQFNIGSENHFPYFVHMKKLNNSLYKACEFSGICHLMPMKRKIINSLIKMIEDNHNEFFWLSFLKNVDPIEYPKSGASEYEILLNYTKLFFPEEMDIRQLKWKDTKKITENYDGVYEACHWHMRQ
jgi:hypothetical protein